MSSTDARSLDISKLNVFERKELKRKKSYAATWDDYVNSSKEEETKEVANIYFIALEGEEEAEVNVIEHSDFSNLC